MQSDVKIGLVLIFLMLFLLFGMRSLRDGDSEEPSGSPSSRLKIDQKEPAPPRITDAARQAARDKSAGGKTPASKNTSDTIKNKFNALRQSGLGSRLKERITDFFSSEKSKAPSGQTYTVQSGDTLYQIAEKLYNDGSKWNVIYNANKQQIKDPKRLKPGLTITIPPISEKSTPAKRKPRRPRPLLQNRNRK